jgi:uncharacterized radical SAM protein YgiQ
MFLPTTQQEIEKLGWKNLQIILVTGDSYIDSPYIGAAVIGRVLSAAGYRVGIIAQPDMDSANDITRLGQPELFWGVSGGSVDSMVANYTALKKRRKSDDYTPGGKNNRRPDRAVISYTNLIKKYFKSAKPIVLGGIEASLRRIAHYDFWSDTVRGSVLFDSKADFLVYGMAEKTIVMLAEMIERKDFQGAANVPGVCYKSSEAVSEYIRLPDFEKVKESKEAFSQMFHLFYTNNDPLSARGLVQKHGNRFLIQNPPAPHLSSAELDRIYELDYQHEVHPYYKQFGLVRALDTIKFSITSHRGCYGECHFCAISVHQGRTVLERSQASIIREAEKFTRHPKFKGYIYDVGGPTANMYGFECKKKIQNGACPEKRCLGQKVCPSMPVNHQKQISLLNSLRQIPGIKKVFISSVIRYDLIQTDKKFGYLYLENIIGSHISGQLKIAPEHTEESILQRMGKPGKDQLVRFKNLFYQLTQKAKKNQFLTYYFIAAYPGCRDEDMSRLKKFCSTELKTTPEQVQIFTPTPSTYASLMYYTERDPFSGKPLFVEKSNPKKEKQKNIVLRSFSK